MSQSESKRKKLELSSSPNHQLSQHLPQPPLSASTLSDSVSTPTKQFSSTATNQSLSPNTEEFVSPTKSLKSFLFKNRLSSYSIDSINEEPELEAADSIDKKITTSELTPTKSPRFNFHLRPKFIRSRSSGLGSESSSLPQPYPLLLPQQTYLNKKTSVDDFADTESDESNVSGGKNYDAESIDSILQEYEKDNRDEQKTNFVFQEEFDETSIRESRPGSKQVSVEEQEQLRDNIIRHGSTKSNREILPKEKLVEEKRSSAGSIPSSHSMRIRVQKNKIEPIKVEYGNLDSLRASTAFSEESDSRNTSNPAQYPDPTITPLATPRKTFNETPSSENTNRTSNSVDQQPIVVAGSLQDETILNKSLNQTELTNSHMFSETMLKDPKHQSVTRSSMSSGELLQNLESFYDKSSSNNSDSFKRQSDPSFLRHSTIIESKVPRAPLPQILDNDNNEPDMTAGLDSATDLPVMLYKVQKKNYDESKSRWSFYENRNSQNKANQSSPQGLLDKTEIDDLVKPPQNAYSNNNNVPVSSRAAVRQSQSSNSGASSTRSQTNNDKLVLSQPKRSIILNEKHQFDDLPYIPRQDDENTQQYNIIHYPWLHFILLMLVGLVIPPLYLIITIGLLDDHFKSNIFYGGLRYYDDNKTNQNLNLKKFSKIQKIISFLIFLLWVSIALAMIGVGIGLGLTRN